VADEIAARDLDRAKQREARMQDHRAVHAPIGLTAAVCVANEVEL